MKKGFVGILLVILFLPFTSCKQQNEGVLSKKQMSDLLVDVHKSEAVMALNYSKFPNDSAKSVVRAAIFKRHNITQAQFDSSLVWYGNHIEDYMEIYDQVIDRLNKENDEIKTLIAKDNAQILTRAGDTVDIWKLERSHIFDAGKRENIFAFDITADENFFHNDRFILKIHVVNVPKDDAKPLTYLAVRHDEQNINYNWGKIEKEGWNELKVQCDSSIRMNTVYGYIAMPERSDAHVMYIDSIILLRIHEKPGMEEFSYHVMESLPNRIVKRPGIKSSQKETTKPKTSSAKLLYKNLIPE